METNVPAAVSKDERNWAMLAHLSGLLCLTWLGGVAIAFIVWFGRKDENTFAREQAREALNFQITMFICMIIAALLWVLFVGILIYALLVIVNVTFSIIAAVKASEGVSYRYPVNLRLVS